MKRAGRNELHLFGQLVAKCLFPPIAGVTVVVLKDTGHWISEERPKETFDALLKFF